MASYLIPFAATTASGQMVNGSTILHEAPEEVTEEVIEDFGADIITLSPVPLGSVSVLGFFRLSE